MPKVDLLPYPLSIEDFHQKMNPLFVDDQLVQAKAWAGEFVEKSLFPKASDMWLLRCCFAYMPPETIVRYIGSNVANNNTKDIQSFWLGTPPDWEGAVKMMEAAYVEKGWLSVIYPDIKPGYNAHQCTRILKLLQETNQTDGDSNNILREKIFTRAFNSITSLSVSEIFWREPQRWLAGHTLGHNEQIIVWCAYALLAEPDCLQKVAQCLRWKSWDSGQFLMDWEKVTDPSFAVRKEAAEQLWSAQNKKISSFKIPANLDLNLSL